ncbi:Hypp6287 [Branchiostoma lanceolatum]|uniref:Hypp6287 protein n=1 Tax=Branchiostoma lanceolatum TaxID=7740 RepID=A0A8J9YSG1_BRALA|nr:Hypp6287 [Branchiostoma lanceolatum]
MCRVMRLFNVFEAPPRARDPRFTSLPEDDFMESFVRLQIDEVSEEESMSPDPEDQDDATPEDPQAESGSVEGTMMPEQGQAKSQTSQKELIEGVQKLLEKHTGSMNERSEQKIKQQMDWFSREIGQQLEEQNTEIKTSLSDVSRHLKDVKKEFEGQTKMEARISSLGERVQNLLAREINRSTIMGEIKDIENELVKLKEQSNGGDKNFQDGLTEMNRQLHQMLEKLQRDSMAKRSEPRTGVGEGDGQSFDPEALSTFISYTMDPYNNSDPQQREADIQLQRSRVKSLADELRRNGVDCRLDQYVEYSPPHMWTTWMQDEIVQADYVLMVCSPHYLECVTDRVKNSLIQNGVFDIGQWEKIAKAGEGTSEDKASALMFELPRRGPDAFEYFCEALMTCGYKFLGEPLIKEEGAESSTDEEVEREAFSPDTGEQDDATSVDELGESGYVEGEGLQEHDEASGGISHEEERITIKDMKRLFSAQEEKNDRKLDQKIDQLSEKLGQNIDRKLDQKIDQLSNELDQRLSRQNEDIKASLFDISSHLIDIKQALGGQTEMMTQVSNLEKRVRNLLVQQIDRTTIMEEIKDIESEVVELKENFKGGDDKIQYDLTEMNKHLHDMRMMLERDSKTTID